MQYVSVERSYTNVKYVKNNVLFEQPRMKAYASTHQNSIIKHCERALQDPFK